LLLVDVEVYQNAAHHLQLVAVVVDDEVGGNVDSASALAQDAGASRVEGADPQPARLVPFQQAVQTLFQFVRRLVGEGDRQDVARGDAVFADQVRDAVGNHARFA
jgi:hypothetical protein